MATVMVLTVQSGYVVAWGFGAEVLHDLPDIALVYTIYSLGFTLVLGLAGWLVLRLVGWTGWLSYAITGATLGLLAGGLYFPGGFHLDNLFLTSFCVAGLAAALTFRAVYYPRVRPQATPEAAA
jgi:hypothetical protein